MFAGGGAVSWPCPERTRGLARSFSTSHPDCPPPPPHRHSDSGWRMPRPRHPGPWRMPTMAKALFGHVGVGPDVRVLAEMRRLRDRVRELEHEVSPLEAAKQALR